jgi:membrane-associated protein
MILAGYFLGRAFPDIQKKLEYVVILIILISMIPVVWTYIKQKRVNKTNESVK